MSTVAELWNGLTDDQKLAEFQATVYALGEDTGSALIRAIAAHAEQHAPAVHRAPDRYQMAVLAPTACQECHTPTHDLYGRVIDVHGSNRIRWVCAGCYEIHQRRGLVDPGDQLQAFPTPLPIQEGP